MRKKTNATPPPPPPRTTKKSPKTKKKVNAEEAESTVSKTSTGLLSVTSTAIVPATPLKKSPLSGLQGLFAKLTKKNQLEDIEEEEYETDEEVESEEEIVKLPATLNVSFDSARRFNFLVAGPCGSGKSTFCTRLLKRYFPEFEVHHKEGEKTTMIEEIGRCEKLEGNTRVIITIIDTPGFGESMHTEDSFDPIEKYIVEQNRLYECKEVIRHPNQQEDDSRIHCCFYFLAPHRVTQIDSEFMKRMQALVPIVPVVAKADTMTIRERMTHLRQIHDFLILNNIAVFDFKENNIDASWLDEHTTFHRIGMELEHREKHELFPQIPNVFAVISGQRRYMWGIASEHDPKHSDTQRLHRLLFHQGSLGRLYQRSQDIHESWRNNEAIQIQKNQKLFFQKVLFALFFVSVVVFTTIYFSFYSNHTIAAARIGADSLPVSSGQDELLSMDELTPIDSGVPDF